MGLETRNPSLIGFHLKTNVLPENYLPEKKLVDDDALAHSSRRGNRPNEPFRKSLKWLPLTVSIINGAEMRGMAVI